MGRLGRWLAGLLIGIAAGVIFIFWLRTPAVPVETIRAAPTTASSAPPATSLLEPTTRVSAAPPLYLVWTPGGLPDGLADDVRTIPGVDLVSTVHSDLILIDSVFDTSSAVVEELPDGWFYPVEAASIDSVFAELAPIEWQAAIASLIEGEALLTETSAELREVGVGATLSGERQDHRIAAVLPDSVLGGAEVVLTGQEGTSVGVVTPRYLLVVFDGERSYLEESVRAFLPSDLPARIRGLGETPFLRHGDAVLPQALIKETFGEFMVRPLPSGDIEFEPDWAARHIVTTDFPVIGEARCHAVMADQLASALGELERANLGFLVESFDGCFNPRFIAGSRLLSRHAWGAAIDLNYQANPTGQVTSQDQRLVAIMEKWGFTWGGNWLVPDSAHFEWVGPPQP